MSISNKDLSNYRFAWNPKKLSRKQHIVRPDNGLYCKLHHSAAIKNVTHISDKPHPNRAICGVCIGMLNDEDKNGGEPNVQFRKTTPKRHRQRRNSRDPFLHTWEWKQVRYMALKASDGCCELCGRGKDDGAILNVDHIKPRREHPELALSLSNLQVLCAFCNHGKGNRDMTDWREPRLSKVMGESVS